MRRTQKPQASHPYRVWLDFVERSNWSRDSDGTLGRRWRTLRLRIAWRRGGLFWWHIIGEANEHRKASRGYNTEPLCMEALADELSIAKPPKPPEWQRYWAEQNGDPPPQQELPGH